MSGAAALGWYSPESWERLRAVAGDGLCTYAELTRRTEAMLCGLKAEGINAYTVPIDVDHMVAWCKRHGYPISDAGSRAAYAAMLRSHGGKLFDIDTPIDDAGLVSRMQ